MGHSKGEGTGKTAARDVGRAYKESRVGSTKEAEEGKEHSTGGVFGKEGRHGGQE